MASEKQPLVDSDYAADVEGFGSDPEYVRVPLRVALRDGRCRRFTDPKTNETTYVRARLGQDPDHWDAANVFGTALFSKQSSAASFPRAVASAIAPGFTLVSCATLFWVSQLVIFFCFVGHKRSHYLADFGSSRYALKKGEFYRLVSAIFFHVNWLHLAVNVLSQAFISYEVQAAIGQLWFVVLYLSSGICGCLFSAAFGFSKMITMGASGAIFGLVGARNMDLIITWKTIPKSFRKQLIFEWCINGLILAVMSYFIPRMDHRAHLGGALTGIGAAAFFVSPSARPKIYPLICILGFGILFLSFAVPIWKIFYD